jgi:hypothetical protein
MGRKLVRKIVQKCIVCFETKPKECSYLMGELPVDRVQQHKPFLQTGIDYFGPFQIRLTLRRGGKTTKGYAVLFICLSTKAIHLELVNYLTTEPFLSAFRRFISRRGRCAHIYADNATYFTKAIKDLKE